MTDPLFDLSGRVAVVTGGMGQLGAEYVRGLSERGMKVAVFDIAADDPVDVTDRGSIEAGLERSPAILRTCAVQMRPVAMTCIVACVGLLPRDLGPVGRASLGLPGTGALEQRPRDVDREDAPGRRVDQELPAHLEQFAIEQQRFAAKLDIAQAGALRPLDLDWHPVCRE